MRTERQEVVGRFLETFMLCLTVSYNRYSNSKIWERRLAFDFDFPLSIRLSDSEAEGFVDTQNVCNQ